MRDELGSGPESTASPKSFGQRLSAALTTRGHLCVGIDPHSALLSAWGMERTPTALADFGRRVVDASMGNVCAVKPQVAFFEAHGSAGFTALETVLAHARDVGVLVIGDAKRGDIGSTMDGYAEAWLRPGSPLEVDALTVSSYLGWGAVESVVDTASRAGKGLFALASTSNPEAHDGQSALVTAGAHAGRTVAAAIIREVAHSNASAVEAGAAPDELGSFGVVIGATRGLSERGVSAHDLVGMPVLSPGFGAQGARYEDLPHVFGPALEGVIVSVSRDVLQVGPGRLAATIAEHADRVRHVLDREVR